MSSSILLGVSSCFLQDGELVSPGCDHCITVLQQLDFRVEIVPIEPSHIMNACTEDIQSSQLSGVITSTVLVNASDTERLSIPLVAENQLLQPDLLEQFIIQLIAFSELRSIHDAGLTRGQLIAFHSRYKLLLLAHSQPAYRTIGPFVAQIEKLSLPEFYQQYWQRLRSLLRKPTNRQDHTNVLQHVQGYFRRHLSSLQRQELSDLITQYRLAERQLLEPITQLQQYLLLYPDAYLQQQCYLTYYPQLIKLVYR